MSETFGIDFGTTNSVLARASGQSIEVIKLDDALPADWAATGMDQVLPSVLAFDGSQPVFGWAARQRHGDRLEAVKRLFATDDSIDVGGRSLHVETAAAMIFRHIQRRAAAGGLVTPVDRAVVTIPANSRGQARYRTKLSAGLAGIEVAALINEPTAAAMAHARSIGQEQRILVFDWGGGTLDVTVLESVDGAFIEQTSKGVQRLGGIDVDRMFAAAILPNVAGSADWRAEELNLFRLNLERAKIALSSRDKTQVALPRGDFLEVTREQFEAAVEPLMARTREPVQVCLRESPGRIDHLVMVGGSSKMPAIRRFVTDLVGVEPTEGADPMTAVAEGAAIAAGILAGAITDLDFYVGTEHALGVIVHNDDSPPDGSFSVLIGRNTKYPARATDDYTPAVDFQESVKVLVIEGDPDKPVKHEDNVVLKDWSVKLKEQRPVEDAAFSVTYEYDIDGILHVSVNDRSTGETLMDEAFTFGAGKDQSALAGLRREVDRLMTGAPPEAAQLMPAVPAARLSPAAEVSVRKARDKVVPFIDEPEKTSLGELVAELEAAAGSGEEGERHAALERALRAHAYLL